MREIPSDFENPMIRSLKSLHDYLQPFDDISDVDAVAYLQPFLDVVAFPNTNGAMTGRALSSINKFLLYGAVTLESPRGREAINLAVASVVECKFEATNSYSDEVVLMQLLEVMVNLLRCQAGSYISDANVWKMVQTCYRLKSEQGTSQLLRSTAANSLTHLILTLFSRSRELISEQSIQELEGKARGFAGSKKEYLDSILANTRVRRKSEEGYEFDDSDFDDAEEDKDNKASTSTEGESDIESKNALGIEKGKGAHERNLSGGVEVSSPFHPSGAPLKATAGKYLISGSSSTVQTHEDPDEVLYRLLQPIRFGNSGNSSSSSSVLNRLRWNSSDDSYDLPVLIKVLDFLSELINPSQNDEVSIVFALQLINIVLESGGENLATTALSSEGETSPIISVLQGDMCKHLLQNSQSGDLSVLSLTLRVIFNLFNAMKGHLKVQLEVFLTSVHLRIAESPTSSYEQKELALESLLDFCREPTLMLDLYTNYDCDFRCTNLFETLCKCLCRSAIPFSVLAGNTKLARITESDNYEEVEGSPHDSSFLSSEDFARSLDSILSLSSRVDTEKEGSGITVLECISLEGVLAVIDSISRRCRSEPLNSTTSRLRPPTPSGDGESGLDSDSTSSGLKQGSEDDDLEWVASARERRANALRERKQMKRRLLLAARQFNKSPNKQYWLDYAQDLGILPTPVTPKDVAAFFLNTPGLDKSCVGDYLSEDPDRRPFNHEVMKAYIDSFNFRGVRIDLGLRMLLESFRLPGEAQKVDRLMEAFGRQLFEQNLRSDESEKATRAVDVDDEDHHDAVGVFKSADAAFIFAFSIIMLHTDLHNQGIPVEKKMKLEEFIRNNRAINEGENLPESLLTKVYFAIKEKEMRMLYDPHAQQSALTFDPNADSDRDAVATVAPTWDTVLKHSKMVDKASFTPRTLTHLPAGVHERDMYILLFDSALQAISVMFEMTRDGKMAARALEGFRNLGKIAAYFSLPDHFNRIVITLCKYFIRFFPALSPGGGQTDEDLEGLEALRDATLLSTQPAARKSKLRSSLGKAEHFAAFPACRALLTFRALLSLTKLYGSLMRESWRNFVQTLLALHELDMLPSSFVEIDDVVDDRGHRLPTSAIRRRSEEEKHGHSDLNVEKQEPKESGGFFSTLTSFIWFTEDDEDELFIACKETVRDALAACRLNTVFSKSKNLSEGSLVLLLDALLVPLEDADFGLSSDEGSSTFERNTVLCVELLTEVGLANQERISDIWPILRRAYRQTLVNAAALPEGDDDAPLRDQISPSGSPASGEDLLENFRDREKSLLIKQRPRRVRKVGECSVFVVERVVVSLLRISVHMLDETSVLSSLLSALSWLGSFPDELCDRLAARIGSGLSSVLRFHAANVRTTQDWRAISRLLDRYSHFTDSVDSIWDILQTIVQCDHIRRVNMGPIIDLIKTFIRTDDLAALPPNGPIMSSSSSITFNQGGNRPQTTRWSDERAAKAVKLLLMISNAVYSRDPDFCATSCDNLERHGSAVSNSSSTTLSDPDSAAGTIRESRNGGLIVEHTTLPDRHQCWMQCIVHIRGWFDDPRPEVASSAAQCLQNALWSPPERIEGDRWPEVFDKVLFPLVDQTSKTGSDAAVIRATNLLTRTLLHNVEILASIPQFHILWLRIITFMSKSLVRYGNVRDSAMESLKNLIMVMRSEGLFDVISEGAGENVSGLTWSVIEGQSPGIRAEFEEDLRSFTPQIHFPTAGGVEQTNNHSDELEEKEKQSRDDNSDIDLQVV